MVFIHFIVCGSMTVTGVVFILLPVGQWSTKECTGTSSFGWVLILLEYIEHSAFCVFVVEKPESLQLHYVTVEFPPHKNKTKKNTSIQVVV